MSASIAHIGGIAGKGVWVQPRRARAVAPRWRGLALSGLAHAAVLAAVVLLLPPRTDLADAPADVAIELVFAPEPRVAEPVPVALEPVVTTVAIPEEVVVPPPPVIVAIAPPVVAPLPAPVAAPKPVRSAPPPRAPSQALPPVPVAPVALPVIPARPVAGMESDLPPAYPERARRRGEQGRVVLLVDVAPSGLPVEVSVAEGSGHASLDTAAVEAVRRWRFVPATKGGTPVAAVARVPILFRLAD